MIKHASSGQRPGDGILRRARAAAAASSSSQARRPTAARRPQIRASRRRGAFFICVTDRPGIEANAIFARREASS
jgi:hypothetical protein